MSLHGIFSRPGWDSNINFQLFAYGAGPSVGGIFFNLRILGQKTEFGFFIRTCSVFSLAPCFFYTKIYANALIYQSVIVAGDTELFYFQIAILWYQQFQENMYFVMVSHTVNIYYAKGNAECNIS